MDFNFGHLLLILLLLIPGHRSLDRFPVTCEKQNICALIETQVTLKCSYSNMNIKTVFWFSQKQSTNWRYKDEPEDLTVDSDYSGRVKHQITNTHSTLIISDLRERDSGEYHLMFIMKDGVKHLSSSAVNLTVTVLQVKINPQSTEQRNQTELDLSCDTSCTLTSIPQKYYWKQNGRYITDNHSRNIKVQSSEDPVSYSCFLSPDFKNTSSPVCISKSKCWNVTYTSTRVCALPGDFLDLRKESWLVGRVEYLGNTLRIKDVKMSDSREYGFRIITNRNSHSGSPGVILTVTDTQVTSSPATVSEGEKVILSCSTKCTLNIHHTYVWYKNGQQVTDGVTKLNKLYLDSVIKEELQEYSCDAGDFSTKPMDRSAFGHYTVTLLVFLPQFLLIAALWMWFFHSKKKVSQNRIDRDRNYENVAFHMTAVSPSELVQ
ncbi:sialoadhesin-like isoform X2 [Xyrauchen texanus]|uniref:sialoadhesin-like isoform X2 n=1 Tax=Xyrauchen texanus TaxID=154827 RepID=UPI0022424D79|nr:sialoadhesin-like isoform X2 [Xyrauchen texanus]